ncbi:MAG: CHAT domain-containing protein [Candidatus Aminicenantes bacterium]|nr:CHAT domain-containing protein [Candidatus Aminicenantes bacterium]
MKSYFVKRGKLIKKHRPIVHFIFIFLLSSSSFIFSINAGNSPLQEKYSSLVNSGEQTRLKGDYDLSIQFFEEALVLAKRMNEMSDQVQVLCKLGLLSWNIGQIDSSTKFYQEALSLTKKNRQDANNNLLLAIDISRLYQSGKRYRNHSQLQDSIYSFKQAVALAQKINSREHLVKCLRQLGVTYLEMNDVDGFYKSTKQALDLAKAIQHRTEEGNCSYNIGLYYNNIHDYSQALKYYEEALFIFRETKSISYESNCLGNISDIYIQLGNYEKALQNLTDVLFIDRQIDEDLFVAMDLNNIGVIYRKKGLQSDRSEDLLKALTAFEESLFISRQIQDKKIQVQCLSNISTVYTDLKKYSEALRYMLLGLEIAESLKDKEEVAIILLNMGTVFTMQGKYEQASEVFDKALDLAYQINEKTILWEAHAKAGLAFKEMNNYGLALDHFNKSIELIEDIRSKIHLEELKATYLGSDGRIDSYYNLVDLLLHMSQDFSDQDHLKDAFETMEKAKARAFLDRLELSRLEIRRDVNPDLLDKENILMEEISHINSLLIKPGLDQEQKQIQLNELDEFERELETLNRKIRLESPSYANLKNLLPVSLEEAQASLPDNSTAYFAYCVGKNCSYSFVITRGRIHVFELPPAEILRAEVRDYLQIITDKDSLNFQSGYKLFSLLVQPGLDHGMNRIIFIPDDILHFLPFETLLTQKEKPRWLVQDYRISYVPSITSFREILLRKTGKNRGKDILSYGNPFFGEYEGTENSEVALSPDDTRSDFRLIPLRFSQMEVEKIATLFKKNKRDVYTGEEATETSFKRADLADYKIIHFATHGLIDNHNPARSSIVLSLRDLSSEDGFLQMREVFDLKMNADLVVLSACQTGLGQYIKGEGIEGINRAFFFAGASSVLMSLWAVNDQASYQFMQRFYTHLRSSDSIVDALRQSKIEMINSDALSHPFYWAGFIVSGHADKVVFSPGRRKKIFPAVLFAFLFGVSLLVASRSRASKPSSIS